MQVADDNFERHVSNNVYPGRGLVVGRCSGDDGWLQIYWIMGRSVHMNEGLVFIAIMIATILEGIMGALLVVPLLATVAVTGEYVRRKVLGLPAFEEGSSVQFVKPARDVKRSARKSKKAGEGQKGTK